MVDKELPEGWAKTTLSDVAQIEVGNSPKGKTTNKDGEGLPVIVGASDIDGGELAPGKHTTSPTKVCEKGDLIFCIRATIGKCCFADRKYCLGRGVAGIRPVRANRRWLKYLLDHEEQALTSQGTGSTFSQISKGDLESLQIALPPLFEQRRIADRLDAIQSRTQATGETLDQVPDRIEEYRQSVLNAAFTGRLTADWREDHPGVEPAEELLKRILDERREQWEEDYRTKRYDSKGKTPPDGWKDRYSEPDPADSSDLPSLPSSWKWVRFEQISLLDSGYAFSSDKFADEGMPLLRGANVAPGHLKWGDTEYWPEDEVGPYEHLVVEEGDIILAMDRPLINAGLKIARADESDTPCLLVQRVARFKPVFESLTPFLYLTCSTPRFIAHLREGQTGTQIPHVSKKSLRAYPVPLPPLAEQKEIARRVRQRLDKIDEMARHVEQAGERLDHLDRSVLAVAFRGELVETEAERARREDRDYETAEELLERVGGESSSKDQNTSSAEQSSTTPQVDENGQFEMKVVEDDPDL